MNIPSENYHLISDLAGYLTDHNISISFYYQNSPTDYIIFELKNNFIYKLAIWDWEEKHFFGIPYYTDLMSIKANIILKILSNVMSN